MNTNTTAHGILQPILYFNVDMSFSQKDIDDKKIIEAVV